MNNTNLTRSQINYIIAIKQLIGGEVSQKYICEYLGIKKPSASIALRNLEENGYITKINKGDIYEYALTDKSWAIVDAIEKERYEFISLFHNKLGIPEELCKSEYKRVCGDFSAEFTDALSKLRKNDYVNPNRDNQDENDEGFCGIAFGEYEIPFRVIQGIKGMPSMGDRGFIHPATLVINKDKQYIVLESRQFYYKSKDDQMLKGKLSSLCYADNNMKWTAAEEKEENKWIVPLERVMYQKDNWGKPALGIIKIKAKATTKKMPESSAEVTFNFKLIKRIN